MTLAWGCANLRAGDILFAKGLKSIKPRWGAVTVDFPDRILWEDQSRERREQGVIYLYELTEQFRRQWRGAISERLSGHGLKVYPAEVVTNQGSPFQVISPNQYSKDLPSTVVLDTQSRGKPNPVNGQGTRFLMRPLAIGPGNRVGTLIDRPTRYDFQKLAQLGAQWVVVVDLVEWTLVRQADGGARNGFALLHLSVVDLENYRVLAYARIEKPAADRRDWIFGGNVQQAPIDELVLGRTHYLDETVLISAQRVASLVEARLGLVEEKAFELHSRTWNYQEPVPDAGESTEGKGD